MVANLRAISWREAAGEIVGDFRRHSLLIHASAIAFRVLLALIPLLLFGFGLLGFLHLSEVWSEDIAPDIRPHVSDPAFEVIDDTIRRVLGEKQLFWATAGAAIAIWEVSGAVRAEMRVLNRIYETEETRSLRSQFLLSFWLAATVIVLVLGAVAVVKFGPYLVEDTLGDGAAASIIGFLVRWAIAIGLLLATVALLVRAGPDKERPLGWVTYGAALVVGSWTVISLLFGLYLTEVADYGSIFGNLASLFIVIEYLYLSAIVFLTGILFDAFTRRRVEGS